jgi:ATP-dependent helicase Lhr and Lhr-like helicase
VHEWFAGAFPAPTPAQELAWPAIATGEHVLLSAPTGSGKTLAAFLWALDRLVADPSEGERGTRLVYVSPLKALSHDIERNLRAPLRGIEARGGDAEAVGRRSAEAGPLVRVGIRTGDTPQRERAQMLRRPPDVLITTPESLYLMLTSRARETLRGVEWVIIDEIHAVAGTKRGAHLALTLERLDALAGGETQRIGLSATQRPLEEVARFMVGPRRQCRVLDASAARKPLDVQIHVPVESMTEPEAPTELDPLAGGEPTTKSIWPAIYPELLKLIREHRSTIVFVNNRRSAERLALRLNELAAGDDNDNDNKEGGSREVGGDAGERPEGRAAGVRDEGESREAGGERAEVKPQPREIARAHHGSLAREERMVVEELLKAGEIPCIVATSSLELGIDMGAVDLVVQVESPKSVAAGLQRIGRAGHNVGDVSKGRIFPKFRGDLLECAVLVRRMREGEIEPTVVPRNPLDVLAQQVVAIAAAEETVSVDELYALVTRTHTYAELGRGQLENVLDMLDGRYPSSEFAELRPRIVWDRVAGTLRARRGARQLAVTNAGTIPDRGLYMVTLPDGRRVGELDEEMVYEARPGQVFLLGASSWRIEEIGRDRVTVTPAPGVPGAVPFWKGDGIGRPKELGEAIGRFARWAVDQEPSALERDYDLDPRAARNLVEYLREQQAATRVVPSDRTIVVERFRDEIGDWRVCVLSPYGRRIHAAWALALTARIREELGLEADALASDDGIVVHLPDADAVGYDFDAEGGRGADVEGGRGADVEGGRGADVEGGRGADVEGGRGAGVEGGRGAGAEGGRGAGAEGGRGAGAEGGRGAGVEADRGAGVEADHESGTLAGRATAGPPGGLGWDPIELVLLDPDELEDLVVAELSSSALFGARFREAAARALLIPRAYPGRRRPLWQQRLKAQTLLEVARRYGEFPIVLETYRECLRDVLDLPGLRDLLGRLHRRELSLVEVETPTASPYASSLLFDYVATYMYEGDTPNAERRAAALSLDRDLLRELLGQEELRELIDAGALAALEDELQHRSPRTRAASRDELHDVLRRVGDLTAAEAAARVHEGVDARALLAELVRERRAALVRVAGEERYIAAADAGCYRDALGVVTPGGLPEAFLADVPGALVVLLRRYAQTHGPFPTADPRERYGLDPGLALAELERAGELVRGELRPGGSEREWCDTEVLRRLRRASLAVLRKEIEPADPRAFAVFLAGWQGVDRWKSSSARLPAAAGIERLREQLVPLQGLALTPLTWERDVLPRRLGEYAPTWMDALCSSGELVWVGAGALGRTDGRVALYFREDAALLGPPTPPPRKGESPAGAIHEALRAHLAAGSAFFPDLLAALHLSDGLAPEAPAPDALAEALWDLVWAGEVTNDAFAPLRASRLALARAPRAQAAGRSGPSGRRQGYAPRFSARRAARASAQAHLPGRWSLTGPLFGTSGAARAGTLEGVSTGGRPPAPALAHVGTRTGGVTDPSARRRALAELLLERYGILTRELVLAEGVPGGFAALYPELCQLETLGVARRGYFVEGLGGAQFALPGAVERLRAQRAPEDAPPLVLAATDPAQPYGAALAWPARQTAAARTGSLSPSSPSPPASATRRPARVPGAHVVAVGAEPVLYLERGGRALQVLCPVEDPRVQDALGALADHVRAGRVGRLGLERVNGAPVMGSAWESALAAVGFHAGPRRLTLSA